MWPILLCSIFFLAAAIERVSFFLTSTKDPAELRKKVIGAVKRGDMAEALKVCEASPSLVARIFKAGLLKSGESREEIVLAMDREAQEQVPRIEKWLPALSMIANIAPLLGFLGTALGLASSFHIVQMRSSAMGPVALSHVSIGIWQALIVTIAGLLVGISSALVYNGCVVWAHHVIIRMEKEATDLADFLSYLSDTSLEQDKEHELSPEP